MKLSFIVKENVAAQYYIISSYKAIASSNKSHRVYNT